MAIRSRAGCRSSSSCRLAQFAGADEELEEIGVACNPVGESFGAAVVAVECRDDRVAPFELEPDDDGWRRPDFELEDSGLVHAASASRAHSRTCGQHHLL